MIAANELGQKRCIGDEQDGCGFFASQIREMEVIVSEQMRAHQGKNNPKGNVTIRQHNFERIYKGGRQDNGYRQNERHRQRPKKTMWKEKEEPHQYGLQAKRNNAQEKIDDIKHQKVTTANLPQINQKAPANIREEEVYPQCQQRQKQSENSRDKSLMHVSNQSNQKSTDTLNMAYIECHQHISTPIDEDLTAFIEKQFGQSHQQPLTEQNEPMNDDGLIMEESFNIQCVNIDLNPKKASKKQKKVPKGKNQKIILEKKSEDSLSFNIGQSILTFNDLSMNKSLVQSEKSIIMTTAISNQLHKFTLQTFQKSPYRKIDAQIFTNGCVGQFKVERIVIKPFEMVNDGVSLDGIVKFGPNKSICKFPSRQYYDHVTKITLCQMRVPQLSINFLRNDVYYKILGGLLLRIDSFLLKCTNCSGKMYINIGKTTNQGMQSCQGCSMALKIVVNSIFVREQE